MGWKRLARHVVANDGDQVSQFSFDASDYLKIVVWINKQGTGDYTLYPNAVTSGSNFTARYAKDFANTTVNNNHNGIHGNYGQLEGDCHAVYYISNIDGEEKHVQWTYALGASGNNAPDSFEAIGKYTTKTGQITSLSGTIGAGGFGAGSTITVYGKADNVVTDEKQTLADKTNDITQVASTSDITDLTWTQTVGSSTSDTFYVLKDTSNDLMDIKASGNCGTESSPSIAYATLSEALGTTYWRMRFKLVFNTVTAESTGGKSFFTNFFIVDDGTSSSGVGSENGFGFKFIADAGSTQTQFYVTTGGTDSGTTMNWTPSSGSTIYAEISWEGGTATANFYSDSGYSSRVGSTTVDATRSGTFSGLKFQQIALRQDNGGNGVMEIDMSNLEIINRISASPNVGTQYRETDTRKIYRATAGATYESDFTSDNWTDKNESGNGLTGVDTTDQRFEFKAHASGAVNDSSVYDLGAGNVSDTQWVLRWEYTWTSKNDGNGNNHAFGLSSKDHQYHAGDTGADYIFMCWGEPQVSGQSKMGVLAGNGTATSSTGHFPNTGSRVDGVDLTQSTTYYMELKRNSATSATFTVKTGSHDGTELSGFPISNTSEVVSGLSGLRYVKFMNRGGDGSRSGDIIGHINNIEFYNDTTSASEPKLVWKERGSA